MNELPNNELTSDEPVTDEPVETVPANNASVDITPLATPAPAPDISTPEGLAVYRAEFRKVAFWPRQVGLGLIIAGALGVCYVRWGGHGPNPNLYTASMVVLACGWLLMIAAFLMRSRYHRRRMNGV
jgi:hypothetical protein